MKKTLFFLLISNFLWSQWSISNADRDMLTNIYNATGGDNWNRTWDFEQDPQTWFGISVKNGTIVELNLSNNGLKGNFPVYIASLKNLQKLDLSNNQLSGEVPAAISSLNSLTKIDLSNNRLTGNPTAAFAGLFNVEDLGLGGNLFTISDVNSLLQNFNNIKILNIADLGLTNIPQKISTFPNLETLILDNNPIAANAYETLTGLSNLKTISLSGTQLTQIPAQVYNLRQITSLDISNNQITEQNTGGLSALTNLDWLSLENNRLTQIPSQISQLQKLQTLNLGRNKVARNFSAIINLPKLQQIFLNDNQLLGDFPLELVGMKSLLMVNIDGNQLSGELPAQLPKITFIRNNRFTKDQLLNYVKKSSSKADLDYSPQRYDSIKTVVAQIDESAKLDQSLTGNYTFTWFKNLGEKLSESGENLSFSNVKQTDYAVYTAEAHTYSVMKGNNIFELSLFREPITLADSLSTLSTSEIKDVYIYPNPASDYINIIGSDSNIEKVSIYDLSGRQLLSDFKTRIYVAKLPSGVYVLNLKTRKGIKNFKFIKK